MKISLQMGNIFEMYVTEYKRLGFGLVYRGYSKTFIKILSSSAFFFPIYDMVREQNYHPVVSSLISAIISTTLMQPIDYLKTRHIAGLQLYQGFNPLIYYKGLSLNLARIVPHFIIMMCFIDKCENMIHSQNMLKIDENE
jgi:hypothetical protein